MEKPAFTVTTVEPEGDPAFERYEAQVPVSRFLYSHEIKRACEGCPNLGYTLSCPPESPYFPDYVSRAAAATVISFRAEIDHFEGETTEAKYHTGFRAACRLIVEELLAHRAEGRKVLGSGPCRECETCVGAHGGTDCKQPDRMIYSLESLGVNVMELAQTAFGFELDWLQDEAGPGAVSAVGAIFYD